MGRNKNIFQIKETEAKRLTQNRWSSSLLFGACCTLLRFCCDTCSVTSLSAVDQLPQNVLLSLSGPPNQVIRQLRGEFRRRRDKTFRRLSDEIEFNVFIVYLLTCII